jgi:hypothetical protein
MKIKVAMHPLLRQIFLLSLLLSMSSVVHAGPSPKVMTGLSFNEVVKIKGFPISTDTHETSRIVVWNFKHGPIYFKDGKTVPRPKNWNQGQIKPKQNSSTVLNRPISKKSNLSQTDVDEIISAIPNDKGGPAKPNQDVAPDSDAASSSN